jgi:hypothetical protein
MSIRFQIDRSGNFSPDTQQEGRIGDTVSFVVADGATFTNVYVFSGSAAPDSTLFGTTSVRTANDATIQSSAVLNRVYTLSVSETLVKNEETVIKNGTIKVGS